MEVPLGRERAPTSLDVWSKWGLPTEIHEEKRGPDVTTRVEPMKEYARVELRRSKDPTEQEVQLTTEPALYRRC